MKAYSAKREVVDYNSKGQAIGKASVKLGTFLGALGRTMVPIIYENWRKVPKELKDKLWSYVKVYIYMLCIFVYQLVAYFSSYDFDILNL